MAIPRLYAWVAAILWLGVTQVTAGIERRDVCDSISLYLSSFSSYPQTQVNSFCSSLLHYPSVHETVTRTRTARTTTSTTETVTTRKISTTTTVRPTLTVTELVVVTRTFTSRVPYADGGAKARRDAALDRRQSPPLRVRNGQVLGKPVSVASEACSCIVTKPTSTVIVRTTSTSTVTDTSTVTRSRTRTITSYPITTVTKTTTRRITSTICIGANPSPSFKLQFQDTGPTDQYNNQYLSYAPFPAGEGFDGEDKISGSATRAGGKVFYTDCISRLTTDGSFGQPEYFMALTGGDIASLYLVNQTTFLQYDAAYLLCDLSNGFLDCNAAGGYTILQTTPHYEPLGTILVVGTVVGSNEYYPFRWKAFTV